VVGILVPFWDGLGLGAMLVSGRVTCPRENGGLEYFPFEIWSLFRWHVNLRGCKTYNILLNTSRPFVARFFDMMIPLFFFRDLILQVTTWRWKLGGNSGKSCDGLCWPIIDERSIYFFIGVSSFLVFLLDDCDHSGVAKTSVHSAKRSNDLFIFYDGNPEG